MKREEISQFRRRLCNKPSFLFQLYGSGLVFGIGIRIRKVAEYGSNLDMNTQNNSCYLTKPRFHNGGSEGIQNLHHLLFKILVHRSINRAQKNLQTKSVAEPPSSFSLNHFKGEAPVQPIEKLAKLPTCFHGIKNSISRYEVARNQPGKC